MISIITYRCASINLLALLSMKPYPNTLWNDDKTYFWLPFPHRRQSSRRCSCRLVQTNAYEIQRRIRVMPYPETEQVSPLWRFQIEPNLTKVVHTGSSSKPIVARFFFKKTGYVATAPLKERRCVNSKWYTTIFLPWFLFIPEVKNELLEQRFSSTEKVARTFTNDGLEVSQA